MSKYHQLSQEERYTITGLLRSHKSRAFIARELKRSPSTISRELGRNRKPSDHIYRAEAAHSYAVARRRRAHRGSRFTKKQLQLVIRLLKQNWSPEQISNILWKKKKIHISHETIYKLILQDKKKGGNLFHHLRIMPKLRRKRYNSHDSRGILRGKRHISKRPKSAERRKVLGHWEGDTMIGKDLHHCLLTLVERKSGYVVIRKLRTRTEAAVTKAAAKVLRREKGRIKTITLDNGSEFHNYKELERRFSVKFYFATPYHSWERGTNENTNGLIRQYLPRGTCMRKISQLHCDRIAFKLNTRPRKRHEYRTPKEVYYDN
jgi:transposase, IS30 family